MRVRGPGFAIALALALVLAPGGPGSQVALAQTSRPEIARLDFHGNQVFGDGELRDAILNRATECKHWFMKLLCWADVDWSVDRVYLQPRELPFDAVRIQAYYLLRGYRETAVETRLDEADGDVEVDFFIDEGEPVLVESLDIFGLEEIEVEGVLDDLPLQVGAPLSFLEVEAVKDTLISRLREVGYAHADVFSGFFIPADTRRAEVTFDVDHGPQVRFGEVSVEWFQGAVRDPDPELDEVSIRRMVPFRQGGLYRYSQLVEGQANLYGLELIRTARVQPVGDSLAQDTIMPVGIQLVEGDLHRVRAGGGWSTADCLSTEAQWSSRNFRGGARRLTVRARVSNILAENLNTTPICRQSGFDEFARVNGQLSVELFQPWLFSPRNNLTINAFVERQSIPDIFVREALGLTMDLTRNIGRGASATLAYQPTLTRLEAGEVFFCISFLLCNDEDILVFESANLLSPVVFRVAVNRSNRLLNPTAGYSAGLELEHASRFTASDFPYNRVAGEAAGYVSLGGGAVLAGRVRSGIVSPGAVDLPGNPRDLSHPQKRFYSGGANSVRGFGENRLGPRVLSVGVEALLEGSDPICLPEEIVAATCDAAGVPDPTFLVRATGGDAMVEGSLELRFPLFGEEFQGAAFVDAGQVWTRDGAAGISVDLGELETTPGLGVRYFSPIGPIRLDVGYRFQGREELPVLTDGIRRYVEGVDEREDRIANRDWVRTDDLVRLIPPVVFGRTESFFQRLQLHFSIGQAF